MKLFYHMISVDRIGFHAPFQTKEQKVLL